MPLVSQTFDQLLDFTRTSSATFVGSNGLIQNTAASRNLLTFTQEFDNAGWLKTNTTIAANSTVAPDGTSTADTLTSSAGAGTHYMRQVATVTASTAYAFSFYVKAGTHNFIQLLNAGTTAAFANFDLANGVVGTAGTKSTASITSADNGWYRCTVVFDDTAALTNDFRINIVSSASAAYSQTWTTAGTETVFIWGAQLEAASAATTYTRNNGGVFPPRFDYDPVTLAAKGLLIEEQRTNLFLRSEEFENASWIKAGATVTANNTTSPDGTVDADKLVEDTSSGGHYVSATAAVTSGTAYTVSVYVKASGRSWVRVVFGAGFTTTNTWFDIANGTVGTIGATSASIQNAGNGWYRITATQSATSSTSGQFFIAAETSGSSTSYTGNGTSGIFLYGAQLEAGAFATSYIPTVASQVTRTADFTNIVAPNFAPWYNQSEGTFVCEFDCVSPITTGSLNKAIFAASDNSANNRVFQYIPDGGTPTVRISSGAATQGTISTTLIASNAVTKTATAYKVDDFALVTNGGTPATDTLGLAPVGVNRLEIGNFLGTSHLYGHIRSIRYYPTRLTNAQLQALTA